MKNNNQPETDTQYGKFQPKTFSITGNWKQNYSGKC